MSGTNNTSLSMLTSFAEVILASRTATPGTEQAKMITVSAGLIYDEEPRRAVHDAIR